MKRKVYRCDSLINDFPKALKFFSGSENIGVFDIETTGLKADKSSVILIGFLKREGNEYRLYQYFAENTLEEKMIMESFFKDLEGTECLVSFNGLGFDVPFIKKRIEETGFEGDTSAFEKTAHLDIYRIIKKYSDIKHFLPNLKQKTVEQYMGIDNGRKDEISGKESVRLYFEYVSFPDEETLDKIMLHNRDDVIQLFRLIPVIRNADIYRAFFETGLPACAFLNADGNRTYLEVKKIKISTNMLEVSGIQRYNDASYVLFGQSGEYMHGCEYLQGNETCAIEFDAEKRLFNLRLPLVKHDNMKRFSAVNLREAGVEPENFSKYPQCEGDLLLLKMEDDIYYLQVMEFVRCFLAGKRLKGI